MTDAQKKWAGVFFDALRAVPKSTDDIVAHAAACEAVALAAMREAADTLKDLEGRRWGPNDGKNLVERLEARLRKGLSTPDAFVLFEDEPEEDEADHG